MENHGRGDAATSSDRPTATASDGGAAATASASTSTAKAIATAVGNRTWRSWAGRAGGDEFTPSDVALGLWRSATFHLRAAPTPGQACPICYDTPDSTADWLRLWCGCAVCQECVSTWVKAALDSAAGAAITDDPGGQQQPPIVALSCPSCAAPLRPCDAAKVLARDDALLGEYDIALRDACLRGQRDFRPCPSCKGGGFVTWRCVAQSRHGARSGALLLAALVAFLCVSVGCANRLRLASSGATFGDWAFLVILTTLMRLAASTTRTMAHEAAAAAPLEVGCPECEQRFSLAAADAAADAAAPGALSSGANAGDDAWVREHCRPCPRCRAPILKNGGCNAMMCSRCKLHFCWACMRPSRECTHFTCANGAPHGNASAWTEAAAADADAVARAGERAACLAHCAAVLADATALCALVVALLRLGGASDSAIALAECGDGVLALPFDAWMALGLPLAVVIRDLVLALLSYGALGLLLAVVGPFVLHAVGIDLRPAAQERPLRLHGGRGGPVVWW